MAEFMSFVEKVNYRLDFNTQNYAEFREIEDAARAIIDRKSDVPQKKTYAQDFFEKFPNAQRDYFNSPCACRKALYGNTDNCDGIPCNDCWNGVMPDA